MMWWKYYKLKKEPNLAQTPLNSKEELELFYGREKDIKKLDVLMDSNHKKTLLLTGNPGVGKTTLLNKVFQNYKGYIQVDLSKAKYFDEADLIIAESSINVLSKLIKTKANNFRQRLLSNITKTTGDSLKGGFSPGGIGVEYSDLTQKTISPIRNLEIREVIKEVLVEIKKKTNIVLVLDESDFFDEEYSSELAPLSRRMIDLLPESSKLILVNRDVTSKMEKKYKNRRSLIRATFNHFYKVEPAWKYGKIKLEEVLYKRFKNTYPAGKQLFPISKEASQLIDVLSSGNLRILLQFVELVLKFGIVNKEKIPLSLNFVKDQIFDDHEEIITISKQQEKVLKFLESKPTHINDPEFKKLYTRTKLQGITKELEQRLLVSRNTKRTGVTQIFSLTRLGEIILENAKID